MHRSNHFFFFGGEGRKTRHNPEYTTCQPLHLLTVVQNSTSEVQNFGGKKLAQEVIGGGFPVQHMKPTGMSSKCCAWPVVCYSAVPAQKQEDFHNLYTENRSNSWTKATEDIITTVW